MLPLPRLPIRSRRDRSPSPRASDAGTDRHFRARSTDVPQQAPATAASAQPAKDDFQTTPPESTTPEGISAPRFILNVNLCRSSRHRQGHQGKADCRPHLARFQGLREQHPRAAQDLHRRSRSAFHRVCHRPEPDLRRDGQGEQLAERHSRARSRPTTRSRSSPTATARRSGPALPARRAHACPLCWLWPSPPVRDELVPVNSGPFAGCNIAKNGNCVDPNLQAGRSAGNRHLHHHSQGNSHPQRCHPGRRQRAFHAPQGPPPHHLRHLRRQGIRQQSHLQRRAALSCRPTRSPSTARWWATRHAGAKATSAASTCPSPCMTTVSSKYVAGHRRHPDSERNLNGIEKSYARSPHEARNQYTLVLLQPTSRSSTASTARSMCAWIGPVLEVIAKAGLLPLRARTAH